MSQQDPGDRPAPTAGTVPFPTSTTERSLDGSLVVTMQGTMVEERAAARNDVDEARAVARVPGVDPAAAAALADRLEESGRLEMQALNSSASARALGEALALRQAAAQAAPQDPDALRGVADSLLGLGNALEDGGREDEARAKFQEMVGLRRRVVELLLQEPLARLQLAHALWRVGLHEHELHYRSSATARAYYEESLALLDHAWPDLDSRFKALKLRCQNLEALAQDALSQGGDPERAEMLVLQLLPLARQVAVTAPGVRRGEYPPAGLSGLVGRLAREAGRPEAKLRLAQEQVELLGKDLEGCPRDHRLTAALGEQLLTLSELEGQAHHRAEAIRLLDRAVVLRAEAALASPQLEDLRQPLFKALDRLHAAGGLATEGASWRAPLALLAVAWREVAWSDSPPRGLREALARTLQWLGDPEAARWFAEAREEEERCAIEALLAAPGDHVRQDRVLDHQGRSAREALDRSGPAGARLALAAALEFWRDLAERHPVPAGASRGLLLAHLALARLEVRLGEVEAALPHFEPAIQSAREEFAANKGGGDRPLLASLLSEVSAATYATDPVGRWLERLREVAALRLDILTTWGADKVACFCASGALYYLALAARRAGLPEEAERARARGHVAAAWLIEHVSGFQDPGAGLHCVETALERWTWPSRRVHMDPSADELRWLAEGLGCG